MTWVMFVNIYFVQWFFIRLARFVDPKDHDITVGWGVTYLMWPTTGWDSDYVHPWGIYGTKAFIKLKGFVE